MKVGRVHEGNGIYIVVKMGEKCSKFNLYIETSFKTGITRRYILKLIKNQCGFMMSLLLK